MNPHIPHLKIINGRQLESLCCGVAFTIQQEPRIIRCLLRVDKHAVAFHRADDTVVRCTDVELVYLRLRHPGEEEQQTENQLLSIFHTVILFMV